MKRNLLPVFFLFAACLQAQEVSKRVFQWGGWLGYDHSYLVPQTYDEARPRVPNWPGPRNFKGLNVGVFGRWPFAQGIAFQPELGLAWASQGFAYQPAGEEEHQVRYTFADVELPLHLVITNPFGRLPLHGSFLLGGRVSWNFARNAAEKLPFQLLHERLALDAGLGFEIHLSPKWRLQPEFVYSHGLNNLLDVQSAALLGRVERDRLTLRVLVWGF